eukprot:scaffold48643_cov23-Phaeocystis_antarctica.AAC.1
MLRSYPPGRPLQLPRRRRRPPLGGLYIVSLACWQAILPPHPPRCLPPPGKPAAELSDAPRGVVDEWGHVSTAECVT